MTPQPPKKKLYLATTPSFTTMFLAHEHDKKDLAEEFIREEWETNGDREAPLKIKEITSAHQVPKAWRKEAFLWGTETELTALQFLDGWLDEQEEELDPDWEQYLKLKKKFEGTA